MREDLQKKYEALAATGVFTEEQLARLRAGFEKPPRKYDHAKSALHMDAVTTCLHIKNTTNCAFDWQPEGTDGDGNAYIYIDSDVLSGKAKSLYEKIAKNADEVIPNYIHDGYVYSSCLVYKDIVKEGNWEDE